MWAEHCISSPSSPWWSWWPYIFNPREAYNGNLCWDWTCHGVCICYCPRSLSWLDGLLPFPVFLIIVGWLVRGCCRKNLQRFFSKIHFYVIPVFYYIAVLVLLIYMSLLYLSLMKNTEDNNDSFSGSLKHFVFTAGSCWCWCWPGKSILATRSRICLLLVGRDGWSCIHVNSLQKYLFPLRPSVLCFWLQRISGNFN